LKPEKYKFESDKIKTITPKQILGVSKDTMKDLRALAREDLKILLTHSKQIMSEKQTDLITLDELRKILKWDDERILKTIELACENDMMFPNRLNTSNDVKKNHAHCS